MKFFHGVTFLVVCWVAYACSGLVKTDESPYKTKVDYKEKEDDIEILDKDDQLVASVVVYLDEGYGVEKPVGSDVCLVRFFEDDDTCFDESPVEDGVPDEVAEFCEDREIRLLTPAPCYDDDNNEEPGREKRSLLRGACRLVSRTCSRVCGRRCCVKLFRKCIVRCNKYCPYTCFGNVCDALG